jgi:hypothetical protein
LPIEDSTANLVRVEKRLMRSCRQINNRKASMSEANREGKMMVRIPQHGVSLKKESRSISSGVFGPRTEVWLDEDITFIITPAVTKLIAHPAE